MTIAAPPFVLGTVQLGLAYGIANRTGQPPKSQAFGVLDAAMAAGVVTLDTAHAYGTSETVIGAWLSERRGTPAIVTKLPPLGTGGLAAAKSALATSLERLGVEHVDGLMLHRAEDWTAPGLAEWLADLRDAQTVRRVGVSIYSAAEVPGDPLVELAQLPANAFVQSEARSRPIEKIIARGGAIHIRSVFAQGLLLMQPTDIPPALRELAPLIASFQALAREARTSVAALAIAAARRLLPTAELVLGAETPQQVTELAQAARTPVPASLAEAALELGRAAPGALFDPRRWPAMRDTTPQPLTSAK